MPKFDKIENFDYKLSFGEPLEGVNAYRIAPNVVVAQHPTWKQGGWQLLTETGALIQGGLRTRQGTYDLWHKMCELIGADPREGLPVDEADVIKMIKPAIAIIRGWNTTRPLPGTDWLNGQ